MSTPMANGGTYTSFNFDSPYPDAVEEETTMTPPPPNSGAQSYGSYEFLTQQVTKLADQVVSVSNTVASMATHSAVTAKDIEQHQSRLDTLDRLVNDNTQRISHIAEEKHDEHAKLRETITEGRATLERQVQDLRYTMSGQIADMVKEALRTELQQQRTSAQEQSAGARQNFQNLLTITLLLASLVANIILALVLATHK